MSVCWGGAGVGVIYETPNKRCWLRSSHVCQTNNHFYLHNCTQLAIINRFVLLTKYNFGFHAYINRNIVKSSYYSLWLTAVSLHLLRTFSYHKSNFPSLRVFPWFNNGRKMQNNFGVNCVLVVIRRVLLTLSTVLSFWRKNNSTILYFRFPPDWEIFPKSVPQLANFTYV